MALGRVRRGCRRGGYFRAGDKGEEPGSGLGVSPAMSSPHPVAPAQPLDLPNHDFLRCRVEQIRPTPKDMEILYKLKNMPQRCFVSSSEVWTAHTSFWLPSGKHLSKKGAEGKASSGQGAGVLCRIMAFPQDGRLLILWSCMHMLGYMMYQSASRYCNKIPAATSI